MMGRIEEHGQSLGSNYLGINSHTNGAEPAVPINPNCGVPLHICGWLAAGCALRLTAKGEVMQADIPRHPWTGGSRMSRPGSLSWKTPHHQVPQRGDDGVTEGEKKKTRKEKKRNLA
jgi:hypothetical protein